MLSHFLRNIEGFHHGEGYFPHLMQPLGRKIFNHDKTHRTAKVQMTGRENDLLLLQINQNPFTSVHHNNTSVTMGATNALKTITKSLYPKTSKKESSDGDASNVSKKSKTKSKKLKNFWETKLKKNKNQVSLKDLALSVEGNNNGNLKVFLSPITAAETEASPVQEEKITNEQQQDFNISEVVAMSGNAHAVNMSPLTAHSEHTPESEIINVGHALSDALKFPSFDDVHLPKDAFEGAETDFSLEPPKMEPNARRRIRAYGVSARRSVRSDGMCANKPEMKEAKESDVTASTNAPNPLEALPNVFDNLQNLLDDVPQKEDGPKESNEAVLQRETTKGKVGDPIDLTDRDYRLFLRKPADAVAVGLGKFYFVGTIDTLCISK
jgi:hypothetical protein